MTQAIRHPVCRECGNEHALGDLHIWKKVEAEPEACSSVVEPPAHNGLVAGSTPAAPTNSEIPASSSGRTEDFGSSNPGSNPGAGAISEPVRQQRVTFDRGKYQREYMRDLPKARAEGLTVKQWRDKLLAQSAAESRRPGHQLKEVPP